MWGFSLFELMHLSQIEKLEHAQGTHRAVLTFQILELKLFYQIVKENQAYSKAFESIETPEEYLGHL